MYTDFKFYDDKELLPNRQNPFKTRLLSSMGLNNAYWYGWITQYNTYYYYYLIHDYLLDKVW